MIEIWDYAVCAPEKDRCQLRREPRERCKRSRAKFVRHKDTELVIGTCSQHHKFLLSRFGWRDWPIPSEGI